MFKLIMAVVLVGLFACSAQARDVTFSWLPNPESDMVLKYEAVFSNVEATGGIPDANIFDCGLPDIVDGRMLCTLPLTDEQTWVAVRAYNAVTRSGISNIVVVPPATVSTPQDFTVKFHGEIIFSIIE